MSDDVAGTFERIADLAAVPDLEAPDAYRDAMRSAYWQDKDLPAATLLACAGFSRLMASAASNSTMSHDLRSAAKGLMYDLASFTWTGWDESDITITEADAALGAEAAAANLAMAIELDKGDLPLARAHWMVGAHLLTAGRLDDAATAFYDSRTCALAADAVAEAELAEAFGALAEVAGNNAGAEERLAASLDRLRALEDGEAFVDQVTTARSVLGC